MAPVSRLFPDKIDRLEIIRAAARRAAQFEAMGLKTCLIVDDWFFPKLGMIVEAPNLRVVGAGEALAAIDALNPQADFVLYAIEHALDGLEIVRRLVARGVRFYPVGGAPVGGFAYDDPVARKTIEDAYLAQSLEGYAKFEDPGSQDDFVNLCQALLATNHLPGDVVEVGCFRGSSGGVMLDYANAKGLAPKAFHFFDVFEGFNYKEAQESVDAFWANSHRTEGEAAIRERLQGRAGRQTVTVRRMNIISDPFPEDLGQIALANLDVDLLEAVAAGLERLAPRISVGGIMICEDAGHTPSLIGARLALEDFLATPAGRAFTPVHMPSGQAFLIKHTA